MQNLDSTSSDPLFALLSPMRRTAVVDIGANPIDGVPPYKAMLQRGLCTVTGFEPQAAGLADLNARKGPHETYLPYAVGDGSTATLRVTQAPGMSSLFEPNPAVLNLFNGFPIWGTIKNEIQIETRRFDDVSEITAMDLLKIDVQGSELSIFRSGREKLKQAVAVQTEVSFLPLYKGQPVVGDIDLEMREQGFVPHHFADINRRMILPAYNPQQPRGNQVLEADIVYVRDFTRDDAMSNEQYKHLALIAQHCYGSYDLAIHCLHMLAQRNAVPSDAVTQFIGTLKAEAEAGAALAASSAA